MVSYDGSVIEQFADALYRQAKWIVFRYALLGFFLGFFAAALLGAIGNTKLGAGEAGIAGGVCALIGFVVGHGKALSLRLEAQKALCQLQIEKNTRGASAAATRAA